MASYYGLKDFYYEFSELALFEKYKKRAERISNKAKNSRMMLLKLEKLTD